MSVIPIYDEQLAEYLGLPEFRLGSRRINQEFGPRVLAWWTVSVEPSFQQSWVIGSLYEEERTGGPVPDHVLQRGFVADRRGAAIATLEADAVLVALEHLNPFQIAPTRLNKVMWLEKGRAQEGWAEVSTRDGIGYLLRWGNRATEGHFRFSNPVADWLLEFRQVLFRFASQVVTLSGESRFAKRLDPWLTNGEN